MKTYLVTGGAGFIGSHVTERLLQDGNRVLIIDNFNNFYDPNIKRSNLKQINKMMYNSNIDVENLLVFEGDIRDKSLLDKIFKNKIDVVIHLAAMAGVRPSISNPELYYDVNIIGTLNMLEKCKKYNVNKFIFASSSSVYGNNEKVPFSESDIVDFPISPYAATKKSGELLCHTYSHLYNISVACLRFFTVYGPRQRPDLAIHKFTKLIMDNKPIPFYGDGLTERDYTYVEDIIDGIVDTIRWISEDKVKYDVFNLGGDHTISLKEMVNTIEEVVGKKAILDLQPMQPGDVQRTCADITKSNKMLGFKPKYEFKQGITNFANWFVMEKNEVENEN